MQKDTSNIETKLFTNNFGIWDEEAALSKTQNKDDTEETPTEAPLLKLRKVLSYLCIFGLIILLILACIYKFILLD